MDKEMYWFVLENIHLNQIQNELAESELKRWLNMIKKYIDFYWKINDLSRVDKTNSQNLNLSVGSIWTGKCIDLYWEINDLNRVDRSNSQNLSLSVGSIWTWKCIDFYWKMDDLNRVDERFRRIRT